MTDGRPMPQAECNVVTFGWNRTKAFEWYQFEWPWVTSDKKFKVTILFNVKNGRRYCYIYNVMPTESCIWSVERRHYQWPWTTPTSSFKITPFFDAEYLRNGTTYRHSLNEILIATYTRPAQQCHFEWHSKLFNDTKCRTVSATADLLAWMSWSQA